MNTNENRFSLFSSLFASRNRRSLRPSVRRLAAEQLEERTLLSVSPADYAAIAAAYPDFSLPASQEDINILEVDLTSGTDASANLANLKSAITEAGTTDKPDLIVVHTSETANTITYAADEIKIDIDATQYGSITIVGWGDENLTLDANQLCRVMTVSGENTVANLGGMTITRGISIASEGGGIYNLAGALSITNSTISGNMAELFGGGIYNLEGTVTITNSTISGNSSGYCLGGGGICNTLGTLTVVNSTISGNTAELGGLGGGIYNIEGVLTVTSSTISGNSAELGGPGGGIFSSEGTITITNSTISGNSAAIGGGILNGGNTLTVTNSIISRNYASNSFYDIYGTLSETSGHNIIGYNPLFVEAPVFDANGVLTNAQTLDLHLTAGSRAINAGSSEGALPELDLDGNPRVAGNVVDIGAYEFQGTPAAEPTSSSTVVDTLEDSFDPNDGKWSLREALYWTTGSETITFDDSLAGGTIKLNRSLGVNEVTIDGGSLGITLDAQQQNRVMETFGNVTLIGLTITGGKSYDYGGGIFNSGDLTVTNSTISGNSASRNGGGIYNEGNSASLTAYNSIVAMNYASSGSANVYGTFSDTSANNCIDYNPLFVCWPVFDDSGSLTNADAVDYHLLSYSPWANRLQEGYIGAYENEGEPTDAPMDFSIVTTLADEFDLTNDVISLREAVWYVSEEDTTITFDESLFEEENSITLALDSQLVTDKPMTIDGAGRVTLDGQDMTRLIYNTSTLILTGLTISNGNAYNGGGISNDGVLTVSNSTISGNSASEGGGIYNNNGVLTVTNSTISGNSASSFGGGINNSGNSSSLTVTNSIISRNYAGDSFNDFLGTLSETSGHNIIGYNPLFVEAPVFDANGVLTNAQTLDLRLTAGSRAINAGRSGVTLPEFDLDGNPRVAGNGVDIGAYEYQEAPAAEPTTFSTVVDTLEDSFDPGDGEWSLREALYWATGPGTITFDESLTDRTICLYSCIDIYGMSIDGGLLGITLDAQENDRVMSTSGVVTLNRLTITGGKSYNSVGGIYNGGALAVTNSTISGNYYGGIKNYGDLEVTNSTISGNTYGGINNYGDLEVTNSTISGNSGGGIKNYGALTVANSTISGNTGKEGGGIYNNEGTLTVTNSTISGNTASDYSSSGGGICNNEGTLTVTNSTISGNTASGYSSSGGIWSAGNSASLTANNSIVAMNYASSGSANVFGTFSDTSANNCIDYNPLFVCWPVFDDSGSLTNADAVDYHLLSYSPWANRLQDGYIGAYDEYEGESTVAPMDFSIVTTLDDEFDLTNNVISLREAVWYVSKEDTTITFNESLFGEENSIILALDSQLVIDRPMTIDGAGRVTLDGQNMTRLIYNISTLILTGLTISNGNAGNGGGISNDGVLTVSNSTISGNSASEGGGIYNNNDGALTVSNSTISGNSASEGGGIYNYGALTVTNSTISGNTASSGGGIRSNEGTLIVTNSIIAQNYAHESGKDIFDIYGASTETSDHNIIGYNPLFVEAPVFDVDGVLTNAQTLDLRLTAGSRAINAGRSGVTLPELDLAGNPRVAGNVVDIGAYEFQGTPAAEPTTFSTVVDTLEDSFDPDDGEWSLREALYWATGPGTITFDDSLTDRTIYLDSSLDVYGMSIDGGSLGITLDAQEKDRVMNTFGIVTINGLTITGGKSNGDGGGIYNIGTLTVTNSTVSGNSADRGGGINNEEGTLTVTNSTISGNTASSAGGIHSYGALTVTNSTISGNSASYDGYGDHNNGGGIYNCGPLTVTNSTISDNTATFGGGIHSSGALTIANSAISGNSASYDGGGIFSESLVLTVTNSTISGNSASDGGGIFFSFGTLTVTNSTISGNSASNGGGIGSWEGTLIVTNSIIAQNYASESGKDIFDTYGTSTETSDHNIIGYNPLFAVAPVFDINGVLTNAQTLDLRLTAGSRAINAGSSGVTLPEFDLDGNPRVAGNVVDIGAYEFQGTPAAEPTTFLVVNTLEDSFDPNDGKWSLREALYWATGPGTITFDDSLTDRTISLGSCLDVYGMSIDGGSLGITLNAQEKDRAMSTSGVVTLNGLTITGGKTDENGGGIYNSGALTVTNSTITGNTASAGGGIYNDSGTLTVSNSTISGNTASGDSSGGGGIFISYNGTLEVTNSTISGNTAFAGGGLCNSYNCTIEVTNSTISGNTAEDGAGIYNGYEGTITANNSIITDTIYFDSDEIKGSNNLSSYTEWASGSNNIEYDPDQALFEDPANGDYRILPGSQAYNAGSNELALAAGLMYNSKDHAGMPRFYDGVVDIGAYEYYTVSTSIALNKAIAGKLTATNQFTQIYSFAVDGTTTISLSLLQGDWTGLSVKLYGSGYSKDLSSESGEFTLSEAGTYYLQLQPVTESTEQVYTFRVNTHNAAELFVGTPYSSTIPASQYAKLFELTTMETEKILQLFLDAETSTARNEIYVKKGSVPTRSDYDYSAVSNAPDQLMYIDNAEAGTYYVLVYSDYCPAKSSYTLTANLTSIVLDEYTQTGVGTDSLEFTISGAGFDDSTMVYAVNTETDAATAAVSSKVAANGQLVVQFDKTLPAGDYTIRLKKGDDTAESVKTFAYSGLYVSGLKVDLTTKLVVPNGLYAISYRESTSIIYVEYTNNSEFAIAAPLLHLVVKNGAGEENAVMTLDANQAVKPIPRTTETMPDGFYSDLCMLGNGNTPGVLQPGETAKIPVYWRGWLGDMEQVTFSLEVIAQDDETTVNWTDVLFPTLSEQDKTDCGDYLQYMQNQLGNTWGEYVTILAQSVTQSYQQTKGRVADTANAQYNLLEALDQSFMDSNPAGIIPEQTPASPFLKMPWAEGPHSSVPERKSIDPNEILGPSGYGEDNWINGSETLAYQINYENDSIATAPAQRVDVEMYLDEDLDWTTFQFTGFGWAEEYESIADGTYTINKTIETEVMPLNGTEEVSIFVEVTAGIDLLSGRVWASFQSLQYTNLDGALDEAILLAPMDVNVGFLLPSVKGEDGKNVDSRGDGFVTYVVKPKSDLASDTAITSVAAIQFDFGEIIATNQIDPHDPTEGLDPAKEVPLTIDRTRPAAQAVTVTADSGPIHLTWTGADAHSGVGGYAVYYSINDGDWQLWQTFDAETTEATFTDLVVGATFKFYVTATDNVGWVGGDPENAVSFLVESDLTTRLVADSSAHETTDVIPAGLAELTDWDSFYVEFWSEGTATAAAGAVVYATIMFDQNLFTCSETFAVQTPDGLTGEIINQTVNAETGQVTLTVQITVGSEDYTAPGANLYWGCVYFTPMLTEGAGLADIYSEADSFGTKVKAVAYDLERNGKVDMTDFIEFAKLFNQKVEGNENPLVAVADFNGSGTVDMNDFILFAQNFNKKKSDENVTIVQPKRIAEVEQPKPAAAAAPVAVAAAAPIAVPVAEAKPVIETTPAAIPDLSQPNLRSSARSSRATDEAILDLYENQYAAESFNAVQPESLDDEAVEEAAIDETTDPAAPNASSVLEVNRIDSVFTDLETLDWA